MPSGRNSVYGPANAPVFDPDPIRGNRKVYVSGVGDVPPFSVTGFVDGTGESPGFPMRQAMTIRSCAVTVDDAGGTSIQFSILVNGFVVTSHAADVAGETIHTESFALAVNDIVSASITDSGDGTLHNFLVVLRR